LRAAHANRVFCTDKKRIRTENTVIVNIKQAEGVLYKIVDCARMDFHSCAIDDPRGRFFVRANTGAGEGQGELNCLVPVCPG
jgi:hypothetical protein